MRIVVALILVICVAGIIAAALHFNHTVLSPADLQQVNSTCSSCHFVPVIKSAGTIHSSHEFVRCEVCHPVSRERTDFNSCVPCHSVPAYTSTVSLHNAHATTDCIVCHTTASGLTSASDIHDWLRWAGVELAAICLCGMIVNFVIAKIRLKRREVQGGRKNS